ncbi:MAG TPA: Hpt domain-containing protein [Bacteroidia bacterium]|nr:Hpt domain-containing protein [Bacteroidia bacterium]
MTTQKHLNLSYIKALSGGNNGFVVRMLQTFCRNVPPGMSKLNEHAAAGELVEVGQSAHKLKTMFRYVGMEGIANDLERLEFNLSDISETERSNLLRRIDQAAEKAILEAQDVILTTPY